MNGSQCERTLTHAPLCDPGFTYNGVSDRCEADVDSDYNYGCTGVWTLDGTICYRYAYDDPSCNADFIFTNDVCAPYVERALVSVCPSNYVLDGSNQCQLVENKEPICDPSYQYSPGGDQCSKATLIAVGFQCPDKWTVAGSLCEMQSLADQTLMCGVGYSFDETTSICSKTDYALPVYICLAGYERLSDDRTCRKVVDNVADPIGMSCPYTGFELVGVECVLIYGVGTNAYCEDGGRELVSTPTDIVFSPAITTAFACKKVIRVFEDPNFNCPTDYAVYATNYCVKELNDPASYTCSNETMTPDPSNNTCTGTQVETFPPEYICPDGTIISGGFCLVEDIQLGMVSCADSAAVLIDGTCRKSILVDVVDPVGTCYDGQTLSGGVCTGVSLSYPVYSCETGWQVSQILGLCFQENEVTQAAVFACHSPALLVGTECIYTTIVESEYGCQTSAWTLTGSTCSRDFTEVKLANICAVGDVFEYGKCFTVITASFKDGCSDGQVLDAAAGTCSYTMKNYQGASVVCPTVGFVPRGDECYRITFSSVIEVCPNATDTIIGDICYQDVLTGSTPTFGCYDDYVDINPGCQKYIAVAADITCPPNYLFDPATSLCHTLVEDKKASTFICPTDYVKLDEFSCKKVLSTSDPVYSCVAPLSLSGTDCIKRVTVSQAQGYCEPPFVLNSGVCTKEEVQLYDLTCPSGSELQGSKCYSNVVDSQVPVQVCN